MDRQRAMASGLILCWHGIVVVKKGKGSPYSIAERRVPELIAVLAVSLWVT